MSLFDVFENGAAKGRLASGEEQAYAAKISANLIRQQILQDEIDRNKRNLEYQEKLIEFYNKGYEQAIKDMYKD